MGGRWYGDEERGQDARALTAAARESMGPWLAELRPWELFVTLTYDPARFGFARSDFFRAGAGLEAKAHPVAEVEAAPFRPRRAYVPSEWKFRRDVLFWLRDGEKVLSREVAGVFVMERQGNGWPHGHGLIETGGLQPGDIAKLGKLWFERGKRGLGGGYNVIEEPRSREEVSAYCAKYLTKRGYDQLVLYGRLEQRRLVSEGGHRRTRRSRRR